MLNHFRFRDKTRRTEISKYRPLLRISGGLCAGDADVKKRMARTLRFHVTQQANDLHPEPLDLAPHDPCPPALHAAEGGGTDARNSTVGMSGGAPGDNDLSFMSFDPLEFVPPLQRSLSSVDQDCSQDADLRAVRKCNFSCSYLFQCLLSDRTLAIRQKEKFLCFYHSLFL